MNMPWCLKGPGLWLPSFLPYLMCRSLAFQNSQEAAMT